MYSSKHLLNLFVKTTSRCHLNGFLLAGENFKTYADRVMRHALHKGVPPLFVNLRSLYKDPEKVRIVNILICAPENLIWNLLIVASPE